MTEPGVTGRSMIPGGHEVSLTRGGGARRQVPAGPSACLFVRVHVARGGRCDNADKGACGARKRHEISVVCPGLVYEGGRTMGPL